jgi:hypothetical protein
MTYGTVNADVITTSTAGGVLGAGNASIMKNRIINGAMVIDQRNAGASVTNSASTQPYCLDRWWAYGSQSSKYTVQQNAGSVTPPVGFSNYLGVTSLSSYTVGSSEQFRIAQAIEGYNVADLNFGSANAKTVTLSFWVRSSLTGSFGGSLNNGDYSRSYPFLFTINSANTWEQKTITVAGDTTGTWQTTTSAGLWVLFSLGVGSALTNTAGAWATGAYINATGATSVVGTNGATFYITGVQLEVGSSATGYEYVNYQTSLANCQRYYRKLGGGAGTPISGQGGQYLDGNTIYFTYSADLTDMRTAPTASFIGTANTDYAVYNSTFSQQSGFSFGAASYTGSMGVQIQCSKSSHGLSNTPQIYFGAASTSGFLALSSEL